HLLNKGDELRVVGGCVRDFLSNKEVADIDLACKYQPEKVIAILQKAGIKVIPTGIKHGTVTAIIGKKSFEITTLRQDVQTYGRKAEVEFVDDFYLDAKRRDFTINAMSIDFNGEIHDYFGGIDDLESGVIKFIGNAQNRIKEDYLRILRFFRFSCYYANSLNQEGLQAVTKFKNHIAELSSDRIRNELIKIISCDKEDILLHILRVTKEIDLMIFRDFNLNYLRHIFTLSEQLKYRFNHLFRFAALIFDHKDRASQIVKSLNFSNKDSKYITAIINPDFPVDFNYDKHQLLELLLDHDAQLIIDSFRMALVTGEINEQRTARFLAIEKILAENKIPNFPIDGNDLLKLGIVPVKIGKLMRIAKKHWLKNNFSLHKKEILEFIASHK
ncbi:MAG: CCA tRNA nucleotidyltransferase, partial [Proteobacteria bacterium]|nr:CCA tRNA nucleotidyltransferase [Pseudomonadota bacterium]